MTEVERSGLPGLDVSRETINRLRAFEDLLKKWNRTINLVSASTVEDIWGRHIVDSAQILRHAPEQPASWADLGSGGGLPGLVVACILAERSPDTELTLIESDMRKATFLRTASRELSLNCKVISQRIESVSPLGSEVVSARALAPLPDLLSYVARHLAADGVALLQKGQNASTEVLTARVDWIFACFSHRSATDPSASILEIKGLKRA